MDKSGRKNNQGFRSSGLVSILVFQWISLEAFIFLILHPGQMCFNPSFSMDKSGSMMRVTIACFSFSFNPSFSMDKSGSDGEETGDDKQTMFQS